MPDLVCRFFPFLELKGNIMDPNARYQQMVDAIEQADQLLASARERALALHRWLQNGGFYPRGVSEPEVRTVINQIFLRTEETEDE